MAEDSVVSPVGRVALLAMCREGPSFAFHDVLGRRFPQAFAQPLRLARTFVTRTLICSADVHQAALSILAHATSTPFQTGKDWSDEDDAEFEARLAALKTAKGATPMGQTRKDSGTKDKSSEKPAYVREYLSLNPQAHCAVARASDGSSWEILSRSEALKPRLYQCTGCRGRNVPWQA